MSTTFDLEAQTGIIASPLYTSATQHTRVFSAGDLSGTHESRHDQAGNYCDDEALPAYYEAPPAYTQTGSNEPVTLAMYLFKFGFCEYSCLLRIYSTGSDRLHL